MSNPVNMKAHSFTLQRQIYSLISACAQCQGSQWISWSYWRTNCPTGEVTVGQYPLDIPEGTGVPAWAYQDVALSDRWNASLALPQIATGTESTYYGTPTASVSYHVTTTGDVGTGTAAATSQTASSSSGSKSNAGAIAGGVVGGIALLALIGALVWLIIRRRRQQGLAPSPVAYFPPGGPQMAQANNADGHYPAAVDYGASYPPTSPTAFSGDDSRATPKLYDPSDPSTFPKTPTSFGYQSTLITDTTGADHSATTGGRYTGAAEI
ncbi:hypothetical protein FRB90_011184 [Tulasnella sp. 427]|nr:hypothetical protein FRB90_011184 [Tulasnella sp. 427]